MYTLNNTVLTHFKCHIIIHLLFLHNILLLSSHLFYYHYHYLSSSLLLTLSHKLHHKTILLSLSYLCVSLSLYILLKLLHVIITKTTNKWTPSTKWHFPSKNKTNYKQYKKYINMATLVLLFFNNKLKRLNFPPVWKIPPQKNQQTNEIINARNYLKKL